MGQKCFKAETSLLFVFFRIQGIGVESFVKVVGLCVTLIVIGIYDCHLFELRKDRHTDNKSKRLLKEKKCFAQKDTENESGSNAGSQKLNSNQPSLGISIIHGCREEL